MPFEEAMFGRMPDGRAVYLYTLETRSGMRARITNYGGVLTSLELPDPNGALRDVVLGFDRLEPYLDNAPFFGALIGRYANRLGRGRVCIDGTEYTLALNDPPNHLHGGPGGFHRVLWDAAVGETPLGPALDLCYVSPHGEQGYPGTLSVRVRYSLSEPCVLSIDYRATTDRTTLLNLTHHSYFNLASPGSGIEQHMLSIAADHYTPTDVHLIPTGSIEPVADTPLDFRQPHAIGQRIDAKHPALAAGLGYDVNYVIREWDGSLKVVAQVYEPETGRRMIVSSTEPGLQFYSGNRLAGIAGKGAQNYRARAGFCLEAQHFPDSPNQPGFPSTLLEPGQTYTQTTRYAFSRG